MTETTKTQSHISVIPQNGMIITENTIFTPGTYLLPDGITIRANDITLKAEDVTFIGIQKKGTGITIDGFNNIRISGARMMNYYHCISIKDAQDITLDNIHACATAEEKADTLFLDIWHPAEKAYGGAVLLNNVKNTTIENCTFDHSMCGILSYDCSNLTVKNNTAHYCSGFGFHLYGTKDSIFEKNGADYCCRFNIRDEEPPVPKGHMGADATGFLILPGSNNNIFRHNYARLGGDAFFLAGATPEVKVIGANNNIFEGNDGSWSPNIAFEATFSKGNIFKNNIANHCNYGFWLGYSNDNIIENNEIINSRQGGIATENGWNMTVRGNLFKKNTHGILLWSHLMKKEILEQLPPADTSHDWTISENIFERNMKAIRIAARQNHGIKPLEEKDIIEGDARPHSHVIENNTFKENCHEIELENCDATTIENNTSENTIGDRLRETNCT